MSTLTYPVYDTDTKLTLFMNTRNNQAGMTIADIDLTQSDIPQHLRHDFVDALSKAASAFIVENCKK